MSDDPMFDAALEYAYDGFYIIALHNSAELEPGVFYCTCGKKDCKGKHPRFNKFDLPNGLNSASNDRAKITKWWTRWNGANIGCNLEKSHLWVLDVDGEEGRRSFDKLIVDHEPLPDTRIVNTGRGFHFYWNNWVDHVHSGNLEAIGYPGIDIKGIGGYSVLPPSRHYSGRRYAYANKNDPVDAPEWLLGLVKQPERFVTDKPVELKKSLDAVPITSILNEKELSNFKRVGNVLRGSHPWHGSTTGANFQIDLVKNEWFCWRHHAWGRLLELAAMKAGMATCDNFTRRGRAINVLSGKNFVNVLAVCLKYGVKPEDLIIYMDKERKNDRE